ncbi:MAG: 30S ribosome-binding factor RbfA [Candidatus Omnitrophica bacterium]|nr:30S ribosome-binding factor RbfA [Candidatus Omnitrophota bacterium]
MQGSRKDRVGHLLQMELGSLILTRLKDPRLGFVTVTHVDVSADLKSACVYYSVIGDEKKKKETKIALEKATGFLQARISETIKLRYTPRLIFRYDDSFDQGMEIDRMIYRIQKDEK